MVVDLVHIGRRRHFCFIGPASLEKPRKPFECITYHRGNTGVVNEYYGHLHGAWSLGEPDQETKSMQVFLE